MYLEKYMNLRDKLRDGEGNDVFTNSTLVLPTKYNNTKGRVKWAGHDVRNAHKNFNCEA